MFNYGSLRLFFLKSTFGISFITTSVIIIFSLITYHPNDPGYEAEIINAQNQNILGFFGGYLSSLLVVFFNYSSYLFFLFFLIHGFRLLFGFKIKNLYTKFFALIFSILIFNLTLSLLGFNSGIVGKILKDLFSGFFINYDYSNTFSKILTYLILFLLTIVILWCLNLNIHFIIKKIFYIFKIFKFLKIIYSKFKIFNFSNSKTDYKSNYSSKIKNVTKSRYEPTLVTKIKKNLDTKSYNTSKSKNNSETRKYILPNIKLLKQSNNVKLSLKNNYKHNLEFAKRLESILKEYGVEGKITNFKSGPIVTLYEFIPAAGVKTSKVVGLADDIARAMSSLSTRISSQPGKNTIGIEIPNIERKGVLLGDLFNHDKFVVNDDLLTLALGTNIAGEKIFTDLKRMPHLLIAGTTGSGKSVGINGMILSILFRFSPSECKLILIDPKMLELSIYEEIPHLLTPVVTDPKKAVFALKWVVREMENRYKLMSSINVKNIDSYNFKISKTLLAGKKLFREVQTGFDRDTKQPIIEKREIVLEKMPLIVVVIDEMADLMMVAGKEVESLVQRLAQMARASGIHLITATQRPSVDVITGTIKANFPSRISYKVASRFDSRTIINEMGAEQLLGSGDMLFLENGGGLKRLHGGFVSEKEIEDVVEHIKSQSSFILENDITFEESNNNEKNDFGFDNNDVDELYSKAVEIVIEQQKISTSFIQRYLQIGYNRAARIVEKMEENGIISEANNAGKRTVLKKN